MFTSDWAVTAYVTWAAVAIYFLPLLTLVGFYSRICLSVWKSDGFKRRTVLRSTTTMTSNSTSRQRSSSCVNTLMTAVNRSARTTPASNTSVSSVASSTSGKHRLCLEPDDGVLLTPRVSAEAGDKRQRPRGVGADLTGGDVEMTAYGRPQKRSVSVVDSCSSNDVGSRKMTMMTTVRV